jgi:hypothetical protein
MTQSKAQAGIPQDPRAWKVFPRNLTARADYIVPGNPTTSRPEAAIDNCYPGLEMDARNIQKYFMPGMYFDVYRDNGARLSELTPADEAEVWLKLGLKESDIKVEGGLYLWAIQGRMSADQNPDDAPLVSCSGVDDFGSPKDGLYAWRKIRQLFNGSVAIAIGPKPGVPGSTDFKEAETSTNVLYKGLKKNALGKVKRDSKGKLVFATFATQRARYLNQEGVLDPDVYQPGELTRTLCTPWTYDFRDCQCFYWASNKPDTVSSEDSRYDYLNFQRKNRDVEPQTQDISNGYNARRQREIDYAEMMMDWEQLRPVVNGREFGETYVPAPGPSGPLMGLDEIKTELTYLATVEHALAVQYLYAYYSVDAPYQEPAANDVRNFRVWSSANEIFKIAVDEMRHFRWANEVLKLLDAPTTAKRATALGRHFSVPFYLQSLTNPQLEWFVDLERPSRSTLAGLDGMYVGILRSLQNVSVEELPSAKRRQAVEIIKLIVDEGEQHYLRFSTAQQNLSFYDGDTRGTLPNYIRGGQWRVENSIGQKGVPITPLIGQPSKPADNQLNASEIIWLQKRSDSIYAAFLHLLKIAFSMHDEAVSGEALRNAISLMIRMNAKNFELAALDATPLFTLPDGWDEEPPITSPGDAIEMLEVARKLLADEPNEVPVDAQDMKHGPASAAAAHAIPIDKLFESFDKLIPKTKYE